MILTVEMSMYPFQEDYKNLIREFIVRLNTFKDLRVHTTATSTMVAGEYHAVMRMLTDMLQWSYDTQGKSVFVAKFIPGYDPD